MPMVEVCSAGELDRKFSGPDGPRCAGSAFMAYTTMPLARTYENCCQRSAWVWGLCMGMKARRSGLVGSWRWCQRLGMSVSVRPVRVTYLPFRVVFSVGMGEGVVDTRRPRRASSAVSWSEEGAMVVFPGGGRAVCSREGLDTVLSS